MTEKCESRNTCKVLNELANLQIPGIRVESFEINHLDRVSALNFRQTNYEDEQSSIINLYIIIDRVIEVSIIT